MGVAAAVRGDPVAELDRAQEAAQEAQARILEQVAGIDERGLWEAEGAASMTAWLAARYQLTWTTTGEWVRVARALRGLPKIRRAYQTGRLSWDQLRPLTKIAEPETDANWARRGPRMRPGGLWTEVRRRERVRREQVEAEHRKRYVRLAWNEERTLLFIDGMLPREQGAALETALASRAEEIEVEPDAENRMGARLADALVELSTSDGGPRAARLVVHADAEVVAGVAGEGPGLAETESGVRIADDAVRRIACDAIVEWVLESERRPVGVGRKTRHIPPNIQRLLRHRDQWCRFQGCERDRWMQAHHLHHWGEGGPTNLDNLVLLCHFHHRLVHEARWRVEGDPQGEVRFLPPLAPPSGEARASPPG